MGLWRGKVQIYLRAFIFCSEQTIKEHQCIKRKRYIQKKEREEKMGKYLSRNTAYLVLDLGAYVIKKEEKSYYVQIISKNIARDIIWNRHVYIFEPIPEKIRL
jgi:hypothetical protein